MRSCRLGIGCHDFSHLPEKLPPPGLAQKLQISRRFVLRCLVCSSLKPAKISGKKKGDPSGQIAPTA